MSQVHTSKLLQQAEALLTREIVQAQQRAAQALRQAECEGEGRSVIWAQLLLGLARVHSGDAQGALTWLGAATERLERESHPDLLARLLATRGLARQQHGEFGQALTDYLAALRLCESLGLHTHHVMCNIALLYIGVQEYDRAAEYLGQALRGLEREADAGLEFTLRLNSVYCELRRGRYEAVRDLSLALLGRHDLREYRRLSALLRSNLAFALSQLGDPEGGLTEARAAYREALEQGLLQLQGEVLRVAGECELQAGRLDRAEAPLLASLTLCLDIRDAQAQAQAHAALQRLYRERGDYRRALEHAEAHQALTQEIHRELSLRRTQVMSAEFELQRLRSLAQLHLEQNAELLRLSEQDHLTGLLNRRGLSSAAEPLLGRVPPGSLRSGGLARGALFVIDLNGFKPVNDRWGHDVGDELLTHIAARIREAMPHALSARQGGDEFVCFLPLPVTKAQAAQLAQTLGERIGAPLSLSGVPPGLQVSAAIGVAFFPEHGHTLCELQRHADLAMYQAKRTGHLYEVAGPPEDKARGKTPPG